MNQPNTEARFMGLPKMLRTLGTATIGNVQATYRRGLKDGRAFRWRNRHADQPELQSAYERVYEDGLAED